MKSMIRAAMICAVMLIAGAAWAAGAVLVEAKGDVTITPPGKSALKAKTGLGIPEGTTIKTGANGTATVLLRDGRILKVTANKSVRVEQKATKDTSTPIRGISVALNESTQRGSAPRVQGMVKASAPTQTGMTASRKQQLDDDLKKVDSLGISSANGRKLMIAQVYYKYRLYDQALKPLLEIYRSEPNPAPAVSDLIALCYDKQGKPDEAKKYRR